MAPNRPIFASCPTGGPHYFVGGETCVCGGMGAVVTLTRAEYKRLTAQLAAVTAERDALRISLRWAEQNTTHEVCHAHATELGFVPESVADIDALWDSGQEAETCTDPECPVWAAGEWARRQEAQRAGDTDQG